VIALATTFFVLKREDLVPAAQPAEPHLEEADDEQVAA
jgi:hypothetical protein